MRIIPYGPVFIPWLIAALGMLLFAIATLSGMIPTIEFVEEKSKPSPKPKTKAKVKTDDAPKRPRRRKTAAAKIEDEDDTET